MESLIKPNGYYYYDMYGNEIFMYVDEFITNLIGITNEMLQNALELDELFPEFIHFI